jgi:hypothetical protein
MGQVLPGSARTTPAVRRRIQRRQQSLQTRAKRPPIAPKTVAKGRKRTTTTHAPRGPKPASTGLPVEEEASAVAFRPHTRLPVDDGLSALQETSPHLARSALPRCLQRQGGSRRPVNEEGEAAAKKECKDAPLGYRPPWLPARRFRRGADRRRPSVSGCRPGPPQQSGLCRSTPSSETAGGGGLSAAGGGEVA